MLDQKPLLSEEQISRFGRDGFLKIKGLGMPMLLEVPHLYNILNRLDWVL